MFRRIAVLALVAAALGLLFRSHPRVASKLARVSDDHTLARRAVSDDRAQAEAAIAELRRRGPDGLDALFRARDAFDVLSGPALRQAVEQVAQQRDALASRLFWYTDLGAAVSAAAGRRPILSLRLLGNLDEELTCANSRFFRTIIYADETVSSYLRENFVLHWQSVRPVPKMTVDFGDGRVLKTTITGNSVHWILAPDGRPVDALPGLYGSRAFLAGVQRAAAVAERFRQLPAAEGSRLLADYHGERIAALDAELSQQLASLGEATVQAPTVIADAGAFTSYPEGTKNRVEIGLLRSLVPGVRPWRTTSIDDETWSRLAERKRDETRLDEGSRALLRAKELAGSNGDGRDLKPLVYAFERSIAEEQVRSEHVFHHAVHRWFAAGAGDQDVDALTERVYRELFHSPVNDAWLGLIPPDGYLAIDRDVAEGRS